MSQTARTLAEIYVLLADNVSGDISATDLRDAVASLHFDHGELYVTGAVETAIATVDVWVKALGTTTLAPSTQDNFTMPANNRLTYVGVPARLVHVIATISLTSASNNKVIEVTLAKNGDPNDVNSVPAVVRIETGTGANVVAFAVHGTFPNFATSDYLELWVRNTTDNTNVTVELLTLSAEGSVHS